MYSSSSSTVLCFIALCTAVFLVGIVALHPFAHHTHDGDRHVSETVVTAHTGVVDRGQGFVAVIALFFVAVQLLRIRAQLLPAIFQRGMQDIGIFTLLHLRKSLRSGVLNPRPY